MEDETFDTELVKLSSASPQPGAQEYCQVQNVHGCQPKTQVIAVWVHTMCMSPTCH